MIKPLIYNSDIREIEKKAETQIITANDAILLRYKGAVETKIQSHARNDFGHLKQGIMMCYPQAKLEFVQFDNGANLTEKGKFKKWREGTVSGFPDVLLMMAIGQYSAVIFVEFKRIGTESQVRISDNQQYWNVRLSSMNYLSYITNNPIFFNEVICGEVRKFFEKYGKLQKAEYARIC